LAAACACAAAWTAAGALRAPRSAPAAGPPAPGGAGVGSDPFLAPLEIEARAPGGAPAESGSVPARVAAPAAEDGPQSGLVRGRVTCGRLPVADQEIEFAPLALDGSAGGAWDLTDEGGGYEVRLVPGRYGVRIDGQPIPGALLEVEGRAEQRSDLVLAGVPPPD
jgi:hypothetical protein